MEKNWTELTYEDLENIEIEDMVDFCEECENEMSENELEVFETILEVVDTLPLDFFQKPIEEQNEHFGGEGDNAVTETVAEALFWFRASSGAIDAMSDSLEEIISDYEDEE